MKYYLQGKIYSLFMAQQPLLRQGFLIIEDESSGWCRYLYQSTPDTHKTHTCMPPMVLKPAIQGSERTQTRVLDRAVIGSGRQNVCRMKRQFHERLV